MGTLFYFSLQIGSGGNVYVNNVLPRNEEVDAALQSQIELINPELKSLCLFSLFVTFANETKIWRQRKS